MARRLDENGNPLINPMYRGTYVQDESIESATLDPNPVRMKNLITKGLDILATLPQFNGNTSVIGVNGNKAFLTGFPDIVVSVQRYGTKEIPTTYAGRPLYESRKINTLTGFVKCANASIDIDAPLPERNKINDYLNSGFYYE